MYKTKLQELCQKKSWELPVYTTGKNGPCHMPRFTATVTVKGQVFETREDFRSVKEAQNTAAQIAFDHFDVPSPATICSAPPPTSCSAPPPTQSQTAYSGSPLPVATPVIPPPEMGLLISPLPSLPLSPLPSSLPSPPPGLLQKKNDANTEPAKDVRQKICADTQTSVVNVVAINKGYEGLLQKKNDANTKPANEEVLQKDCADAQTSVVNMVAIDKGYKGLLQKKNDANTKPANEEVLQKDCPDAQTSLVNTIAIDKGYEGLLQKKNDANTKPANGEVLQKNSADTQTSVVKMVAIDKGYEAGLSMYKNQLQQFAQKENLGFPVYTTEAQGPPHDRRFKSKVCVDGKSYETPEYFSTLKEAEQAAAKVACQALSVDVIQEDGVLYKNLLQEFAQKKGLSCPSYDTVGSGMSHRPVFVSSVTIGTDTFRGAEAKTKKQAEMNAAKVAYFDLTKVTNSSMASTITECLVADNLSQNKEPTTTTKNYHGTTTEEPDLHAKRAKASPGNMNVVPPYHLEHPSNEQTLENQPLQKWKTVVFPRELNWPIPENAIVMPYNDEKWVAFKVRVDKEATA